MRTIRTKIYKFNELTKKAQQTAIENHRRNADFDHIYEEAAETVSKFARIFSIKIDTFCFEDQHRNQYRFNEEDQILELSGQRLATYIWNNYKTKIFKGKYYGKLVDTFPNGSKIPVSKQHPIGKRHVLRYSKVILTTDCPLTGMCYDYSILQPIYDFLNKPTKDDFKDLLEECLNNICKDVQREIEAQNEDAAIIETIQANEYEFTQDGKLF